MSNSNKALMTAQLMIRKPAEEVFNAFIDPAITTHFWFTKSSGRLEQGKTVTWEWEMYNVSSQATVNEIVPHQKIAITWGDPATRVDFNFKALSNGYTYVVIEQYGFEASGDKLAALINDNTGGFTTVLDGLKAYLEHGIDLNLIADKFPKEAMTQG